MIRFGLIKNSLKLLNKASSSWRTSKKLSTEAAPILAATKSRFYPGAEHSGFVVDQVNDIEELQMTAVRLHHTKTGADYLHISRDDPNNVFTIGFKTPPVNDSGVTHILEHNVLCGSKKFPCRDPFFKMLNRSLATFMNAMTGSDTTFYPFATQNATDFRNLMSVYLDAVLYPTLKELDFLQEGWRLENASLEEENSPIIFKGVVFNEMKGVFSDAQQIFMRNLLNGILPSSAYGFESGGEPLQIPKLTWQQMKEYHAKHYHPSNAYIYTYGNQPLEDHLHYINDSYLKHFERIPSVGIVDLEPIWKEPRKMHITCGENPMESPESQGNIAVSFMLNDIQEIYENFVIAFICELLISGPNSPFYKSLLEEKLGSNFSPSAGYSGDTRNTTFTIGLQGIKIENADNILDVIKETFKKSYEEGFTENRIESVLHSIELAVKHQTTNFGLGMSLSLSSVRSSGGDPVSYLQINEKLNKLRRNIKENPKYLQDKIKQHFIDNQHQFTLTMLPDSNHKEKVKKDEMDLLQSMVGALTADDRSRLKTVGEELVAMQDKKQDTSCLPTLKVSDISSSVPIVPVQKISALGQTSLYVHEQPTNGVTYFRVVLGTQKVPERLYNLIPLFCSVLTEMGAADMDYKMFEEQVDLVSGGLGTTMLVSRDPLNMNKYEQAICIGSHSLAKNFSAMLNLWKKVFNEVRLNDQDRFDTLVKIIAADVSNSLVHNGHSYAMAASASTTNYISNISDKYSGFSALLKMKELGESNDRSETLKDIRELALILLNKDNVRLSLNVSPDDVDESSKKVEDFLRSIQGETVSQSCIKVSPEYFYAETYRNHHIFPFAVNYVAKSIPCVSYAHADSGPLRLVAKLMFQFLHREIREKGGAYGGGSSYSPGEPFNFYSYRDPNTLQTIDTFDQAVNWVLDKNFTEQDINEAKLGVFQKLDAPTAPSSKGLRLFLSNLSHEVYTAHRQSVLDTNTEQILHVTEKYLRNPVIHGNCIIGPHCDNIDKNDLWVKCKH